MRRDERPTAENGPERAATMGSKPALGIWIQSGPRRRPRLEGAQVYSIGVRVTWPALSGAHRLGVTG